MSGGELHHIYLAPGFFGFASLGELKYFAHVAESIQAGFERRGMRCKVHHVHPPPTASLRRRAAALATDIDETAGDDGSPIHIIGHSTGGLDARLLLTKDVSLPTASDIDGMVGRIRSVVTVASPHCGTPTAALFTSVLGQRLLKVLSVMTMHGIRLGKVPLPAALALAGALGGPERLIERTGGMLEQVYKQVLRDFSADRQAQIEGLFAEVSRDQMLLPQLSPEGMDLFNAAVADRDGVRYGCVVTCARPPGLRAQARLGLAPAEHAKYALFRALHRLCGEHSVHLGRGPDSDQRSALAQAFGAVPSPGDNDAIVPTLSQLHGEVVFATWADHLDVVGHFHDPYHDPPHVDWVATSSGFDRQQFDRLWDRAVAFSVAE